MFVDPTGFGKEYFEQLEKVFIGKFSQMLQDPSVLAQVGKGMDAGLEGKKATDTAMKKYLEQAQIPTRDDVARILQYLQAIESRIISLEEKIEDLADRIPEDRSKK